MASQIIDRFLNKWFSRKLIVFLIGSIALFSGKLESSDWVIIGTTYIFMQGATDIAERLMKAKLFTNKKASNEAERDL
jgi:hypothetical protein